MNGLGQSLASMARSIGPAVGGLLWSFSVQKHFMFLNFIGFSVGLVCCQAINLHLPKSLDYKKKSIEEINLSESHAVTLGDRNQKGDFTELSH